jgi:antitoxin component YwqK of YwqJK toxin-antitoxin module
MKRLSLIISLLFSVHLAMSQDITGWGFIDFKQTVLPEFEIGRGDTVATVCTHKFPNITGCKKITLYSKDEKYKRNLHYYDTILIAETNYIRNPNRNAPYRSDQFLQDGISKHWYETGELKTLEVFSLGNGSVFWFDKRGMLESVSGFGPSPFGLMGPSFDYHPNGFLKKKHDRTLTLDTCWNYYDNGILESMGLATPNGRRMNKWKDFYRDGTLRVESHWGYEFPPYKNEPEIDKKAKHALVEDTPPFKRWKQGIWKLYSKEGELLVERTYDHDKLVDEKDYRNEVQMKVYDKEDIVPKDQIGEL